MSQIHGAERHILYVMEVQKGPDVPWAVSGQTNGLQEPGDRSRKKGGRG